MFCVTDCWFFSKGCLLRHLDILTMGFDILNDMVSFVIHSKFITLEFCNTTKDMPFLPSFASLGLLNKQYVLSKYQEYLLSLQECNI